MRQTRGRFSTGRLMAVIAALAPGLAIGREAALAIFDGRAPSILGGVGGAAFATPVLVGLADMNHFAILPLLLMAAGWLIPPLRAEDEDLL